MRRRPVGVPPSTSCPPMGFAFMPGVVRVAGGTAPSNVDSRLRPRVSLPGSSSGARAAVSPLPITGPKGTFHHTSVTRKKISAANKGSVPWNKGRKHSEETKQKISARTREAMEDPLVREKLRLNASGRRHSEATKRKIRKATRMKRGTMVTRPPRNPVPFTFDSATVASLDARITKRYHREYIDTPSSLSGKAKRPMPEETRRKLSESIRRLWHEDPTYRERVHAGIENRNASVAGRGLTDSHKEAISRTLREKHAARRREQGLPEKSKRKPRVYTRKSQTFSDPAAGTRFADSALSEEDRIARDERRKKARDAIEEAEVETLNDAKRRALERKSQAALKKKTEERKEEEAQRANRELIESLALAGQLPSLDEMSVMDGATVRFGTTMSTSRLPWLNSDDEREFNAELHDPLATSATATATVVSDDGKDGGLFGGSVSLPPLEMPLFADFPAPPLTAPAPSRGGRSKTLKEDDEQLLSAPFEPSEMLNVPIPSDDEDLDDFDELTLVENLVTAGGNSGGDETQAMRDMLFDSTQRTLVTYGSSGEKVLQKVTKL